MRIGQLAQTPPMRGRRTSYERVAGASSLGCAPTSTQPAAISTGMNARRKTFSESRGQPHFVQPPRICENAIVSPAAASRP